MCKYSLGTFEKYAKKDETKKIDDLKNYWGFGTFGSFDLGWLSCLDGVRTQLSRSIFADGVGWGSPLRVPLRNGDHWSHQAMDLACGDVAHSIRRW